MHSPKNVFLFDVDNTLLDHDWVTADLRRHLEQEVGSQSAHRYWEIFETLRGKLGYADYLGALQGYRVEHPRDPHLLAVSYFLMKYPFAERLYPGSVAVVEHVRQWGQPVILSDGDVVFQPHKIFLSGLYDVFRGHVLIYVHKEEELEGVELRYPAEHYVVVDDKLRLLAAIKSVWADRVTTVFVRQGHYAADPRASAEYPPADLTVEAIGNLLDHEFAR